MRISIGRFGVALVGLTWMALACSNSPEQKPEAPAPKAEKAMEEASGAPPTVATGTQITDFPAISLDGLDDTRKKVFTQIVNEEICPCDCPKSWAACLGADTKCQPAVMLAEWLVAQLAEGVPGDVMAEQLAAEIGGFSAKPKTLTTAGYTAVGPATAPFTLVEFADFECAHCRAASPVVKQLVERRNDTRLVYKHFPLSLHVQATPAAEAVEAAGLQGKFWPMHDAVFATQNLLDDDLFVGHAKALGLDVAKWQKDRKSDAIKKRVADSRKEGETLGVEATPTFYVNGRPFNLMRTAEAFDLRLRMESARAASSCR